MLLSNHVALWDTIASCEITGASDSSITNVTPNDLSSILETAKIRAVFCNGAASHKLYMKYLFPVTGREALKLPSTSPAHAAYLATIQAYFAFNNVYATVIRLLNGQITAGMMPGLAGGLAGMMLGIFFGGKLEKYIPDQMFLKLIYILMAFSGAVMLF